MCKFLCAFMLLFATVLGVTEVDIDAALSALSIASAGSGDVLSAMTALTPGVGTFLKVMVPVGALVAQKFTAKPDSPELKLLKRFESEMTANFLSLNYSIQVSINAIRADINRLRYDNLVEDPLESIIRKMNGLLDPDISNSEDEISAFKRACRTESTAPDAILQSAIKLLVASCPAITRFDADLLAGVHSKLRHFGISSRLESSNFLAPSGMHNETMALFSSELSQLNSSNLDNLSSSVITAAKRSVGLLAEIDLNDPCYPRLILEAALYDRDRMLSFVEKVRCHMIKIMTVTGICANITTGGVPQAMLQYTKKVADSIRTVAGHLTKWTRDALDQAWPNVFEEKAKSVLTKIHNSAGKIGSEERQLFLSQLEDQLDATGSNGFKYQVAISPNVEWDSKFYVRSLSDQYCHLIKDYLGFHIVITRFKMAMDSVSQKHAVIKASNYTSLANSSIYYYINLILQQVGFTIGAAMPKVECSTVRGLAERMIRRLHSDQHLDGFTDAEILRVLDAVTVVLKPTPALLHLRAPLTIFGDIHGQFADLERFLELTGRPPQTRLLFLGDYVDRGRSSFEVAMLVLCYKLRFPESIDLLRGNHECEKMNRSYGFYEEIIRKRNLHIWKRFQTVFAELPLCAEINKRILCMHGGISPLICGWNTLESLSKAYTQTDCDTGVALDLMWADPTQDSCTRGFVENTTRHASWFFGYDTIAKICTLLDIDLIVRAHEVHKDGHFFAGTNNQLCTVFSAPNYCGLDENCGSVMCVSDRLEISFITLKPNFDLSKLSVEQRDELLRQTTVEPRSPHPNGGHHTRSPPQAAEMTGTSPSPPREPSNRISSSR